MTVEIAVFLVLVATTFINLGVQMYIHWEAYPLLAYVGKSEFAAYIAEYERRLAVPLLLPYALSLITAIIALIAPPDQVSRVILGIAFLLNLAVSMVTMMVAAPVYEAHKKAGSVTSAGLADLMRINLLRLALTLLSGLVILYLLGNMLSK